MRLYFGETESRIEDPSLPSFLTFTPSKIYLLSLRERGKTSSSFPSFRTQRAVEPWSRSFVGLSHRVSFSLGGEGGVDLTGLRSRVLLEGKSVLRHFQLRPSPPSVPIHSYTGTWVRGMAVKLRGHAKRHPPPSLSLSLASVRFLQPLDAYVASSCQLALPPLPSLRGGVHVDA